MNEIKSVYIHIPFCENICSYCDFSKVKYYSPWVLEYLNELEKEINLNYKNELIETLYIGGGTPSSLNDNELIKLFSILNLINKANSIEYTFECNIESITKEKLEILKNNKVNRLSIGIETFNEEQLKFLNRNYTKKDIYEKIELAKQYFTNINIDLIYALPNQSLEDVQYDLNEFLKLNVEHISCYSLMIEPNTKLFIDKTVNIEPDLDFKMYEMICKTLKNNNYEHYEISNFSLHGYESKHNLTYWNNSNYYGFGLGASGYINNLRYTNTKSMINYLKGNYLFEKTNLSLKEQMQEEIFLGLRKLKGISLDLFYKKYNKRVEEVFNIDKLLEERKLIIKDNYLYIDNKYIYVSNDILINFVGD